MKYITKEVELDVLGAYTALEIEFEIKFEDTPVVRFISAYDRDTNELVAEKDIDKAQLAECMNWVAYDAFDLEDTIESYEGYETTGADDDYR